MENNTEITTSANKSVKIVNSFICSAIVVTIFIVAITIAGELFKPLKNLLTEQHNHHWVGKGIWSAIIFFVVAVGYYVVNKRGNARTTSNLLMILSWSLLLALIILMAFFAYEFSIH